MFKSSPMIGSFTSDAISNLGVQNISHIEAAIKISSLDSALLLKGQKL